VLSLKIFDETFSLYAYAVLCIQASKQANNKRLLSYEIMLDKGDFHGDCQAEL
jgi:hypothetical protein